MKPRVILWDAETSFNEGFFFQLKTEYIPHGNISQERHFHMIAWREEGKKQVHLISQLDFPKKFKKDKHDDSEVLKAFVKVLEDFDIQVYHNGDSFDLKMLNARLIKNGLKPLPSIRSVDTLKIARKEFRFNSNRLDYLARYLGYKGKMPNPSHLWIDAYHGEIKALQHMGRYCKQDVDILEFVYHKLMPYSTVNIPHVKEITSIKRPQCYNVDCLSFNTQWRGKLMYSGSKIKYRYSCNECGKMCQSDSKELL